MQNRLLFLFNPVSGTGKAVDYAEALIDVKHALLLLDRQPMPWDNQS